MKNQLCLLFIATLPAHAAVVSWNYDRFGSVNPTDTAGVVAATHWNNSFPSNPTVNLVDNAGSATTLDLAYSSYGTWSVQASDPGLDADGTSNKRLLNGYLNSGPATWNPPITTSSVTLTQIPYSSYDIIVYFSADAPNRQGQVRDGTTTYYFSTPGLPSISGANAVMTQTTSTTNSVYTSANYAIFSGLTGTSQTLTVQMLTNDQWGGIAGFQVVQVPEPATLGLGAIGFAGLALHRRRRLPILD